jgi:ribose transport system ATP-binding protein
MMMGEESGREYTEVRRELGEEVLVIKGIERRGVFTDISFSVREGEIVGLAGLVGSGRTEILKTIFGAEPLTDGEILIGGNKVNINNTGQAIKNGIFLVPEDRTKEGLIEDFTVKHNITLASLEMLFRTLISDRREEKISKELVNALDITPPRTNLIGRYLSGGNQQKVVVSRAFCMQPKILLLDEITKGVDVKAKAEIYNLIKELVHKERVGVLLTSVELAELIEHCDRIIALHNRKIIATFHKENMSEEKILTAMFGG